MGADYNRVENRVEMVRGRKNLVEKLVRGSGQISTDTSYIGELCGSTKENWKHQVVRRTGGGGKVDIA